MTATYVCSCKVTTYASTRQMHELRQINTRTHAHKSQRQLHSRARGTIIAHACTSEALRCTQGGPLPRCKNSQQVRHSKFRSTPHPRAAIPRQPSRRAYPAMTRGPSANVRCLCLRSSLCTTKAPSASPPSADKPLDVVFQRKEEGSNRSFVQRFVCLFSVIFRKTASVNKVSAAASSLPQRQPRRP